SVVDVAGSTTGPAKESNYSYDQVGNILSVADTAGTGTPDLQCFTYDYQYRMTQAWTPATTKDAAKASGTVGSQTPLDGSGPAACGGTPGSSPLGGPAAYWTSYTFDEVGDRLSETVHDTGLDATKDTKRTLTYKPGTHQVSKVVENTPTGDREYSYTYEAAGNTHTRTIGGSTQTLEYDAAGKVIKNSRPDDATTPDKNEASQTSYLYDADGGRIQRKDPAGTTIYLPGTELRLDAGTSTVKATRYYGYGDSTIAVRDNTKKLFFLAADHHGTGELSIDATTGAITQRRFDPYGNNRGTQPEQGAWPGEKGFVGSTIDASTGLTTIGAREYDSFLGKFISPDPVVDTSDPQQLNAYAYAHNRPVSASDPTGLYDPDERAYCQQHPSSCTDLRVKTGQTKHQQQANDARDNLDRAESNLSGSKHRIKQTVKAITKIVMDELGITAALDCFSSGDLGACGETALNVAGSFAGGLAGKFLAKYGTPWNWNKAYKLIKRVTGLVADLVDGAQEMWKASKAYDKAKGAWAAAKSKLAKSDCHSFLPGTQVELADGKRKNIEDVALGDTVVTTDPKTGKKLTRKVVGTIVTENDKEFVDLTVTTPDGDSSLVATVTHPFWVANEHRFVDAGDLKPGMMLQTPEGKTYPVKNLRLFTERQRTHDLTIDDVHAYYVLAGATPILVHNCGEEAGEHVYRGIDWGHSKYDDALEGRAVPRGGDADAASHNGGNLDSPFTSWTDDYEGVALDAAELGIGPGIVMRHRRAD
ncbi:RHS repeat-associated core domain-containing protein, partial [Streptomyces sp. NPDC001633]|uniref:RHS repeat-associated core domain-containing protein n=1 Tax=Streptomyces sp. NPDC001633 TaxID=3364595 RepID=UPI0036B2C539